MVRRYSATYDSEQAAAGARCLQSGLATIVDDAAPHAPLTVGAVLALTTQLPSGFAPAQTGLSGVSAVAESSKSKTHWPQAKDSLRPGLSRAPITQLPEAPGVSAVNALWVRRRPYPVARWYGSIPGGPNRLGFVYALYQWPVPPACFRLKTCGISICGISTLTTSL